MWQFWIQRSQERLDRYGQPDQAVQHVPVNDSAYATIFQHYDTAFAEGKEAVICMIYRADNDSEIHWTHTGPILEHVWCGAREEVVCIPC